MEVRNQIPVSLAWKELTVPNRQEARLDPTGNLPNLMQRNPSCSCQKSNRAGRAFYPLAYSLTPTGYPVLHVTSLTYHLI